MTQERRLRVLMYCPNFWPELTGIGKFTGEAAFWLAGKNYDVTVVTTPPHYPEWKVRDGYSRWSLKAEVIDGVRIIRCPALVPAQPSGLLRSLFLLSFAISSALPLLYAALRRRSDVVFVTQPSLALLPMAIAVSRLTGSRVWLHTQDAELLAAERLGLVKRPLILRCLRIAERFLTRSSGQLTAISENLRSHLTETSGREDVALMPNWVDCDEVHPARPSPYRKDLGLENRFVVLYAGSLGNKQGFETVMATARSLASDPTVHFVIASDGPTAKLHRDASTDLRNITWIPLQPADLFPALMTLADAHVLPQRADIEEAVLPSKLGPMLASGRPVLAGARKHSALAAAVANAGLLFSPDSSEELTASIRALAVDPELCRRLGERARVRALESWDRKAILRLFEEHLAVKSTVD